MDESTISSSKFHATFPVKIEKTLKKKIGQKYFEDFPFPMSPPCTVGDLVQGVVSSFEEEKGFFWLQKDIVKVKDMSDRLMKKREKYFGYRDTSVQSLTVGSGSAVIAEWEGNLYRGFVTSETVEGVVVHFVDWGNSDLVARDRVCLALDEDTDMKEAPLAIRCFLEHMPPNWEDELIALDYATALTCIESKDDLTILTLEESSGNYRKDKFVALLESVLEKEDDALKSEEVVTKVSTTTDVASSGKSEGKAEEDQLTKEQGKVVLTSISESGEAGSEEKCAENLTLTDQDGAQENNDEKEIISPPLPFPIDVASSNSKSEESPASPESAVSWERSDVDQHYQTFDASALQAKTTSTPLAIIDASDGEESDPEPSKDETLTIEQEAKSDEAVALQQSPRSFDYEAINLEELSHGQAVNMSQKLMAIGGREDKGKILSKLLSSSLLHLAADPITSQMVQAAVFAASRDRDLQPSLIKDIAVHFPTLAPHPHGYLTILSALDAAGADERLHFTHWLGDEPVVLRILNSKVGAFVVRRMIEWGLDAPSMSKLAWTVLPHVQDLAVTPTATWVLLRLLEEEVQLGGERDLAAALTNNTALEVLVRDPLGCEVLSKVVTLHEGSLSPRVASWLLRNTSIDAAHAVQLASDVRQQLVDHDDPKFMCMMTRWKSLEESKTGDNHPLLHNLVAWHSRNPKA